MNRYIQTLFLMLLLVLALSGCAKHGEEPSDGNESATAQLKEKADRALEGASDLLAQQKAKLLEASQDQLDKLEQQVGQWLDEAGTDDAEIKQKLATLGQGFRDALGQARQALENAKTSGLDAWQQSKPAIEGAVKKVQQAHEQIMAFLKTQANEPSPPTETGAIEE